MDNVNHITIFRTMSDDGIKWTKPQEVMKPVSGRWGSGKIETPSVIKVNGIYHMYYSGGMDHSSGKVDDGIFDIGHATPTDGITWHLEKEPVIRHHEDITRWGFLLSCGTGCYL